MSKELTSAIYVGKVMHQRLRPRRHKLSYRMFSLLLDIDEIDGLAGRLRLFSRNRFNLFSFHDADHGDRACVSLRAHVERHLAAAGLQSGGAIRLFSMPRILGYVFNPISIYFCHRRDGQLQAILYEVNNTFGQRHSYLIPANAEEGNIVEQRCEKRFFVSPFMGLDMDYGFRVGLPAKDMSVRITGSDGEGAMIVAAFTGEREELSDKALLRIFLSHPLLTLKVVAGIHWEAARLWLKGIQLHERPAAPGSPVTYVSSGQVFHQKGHRNVA